MSPSLSTARAGIQRKNVFAPSGSNVAPWIVFAATVPPVTLSWYQRTVALPPVGALQFVFVALTPRSTVCETHSDWAPPMFVYWFWAIARIPSVSSALAGVATLAGNWFGQQLGASCVSGPVKVEVEILSQSTWSL